MTFAFGGVDLSPYIQVTNVTRPIVPARRFERTSVPGMDGELVRSDGLEAAEITVTGYLTARAVEDVSRARRVLAGAMLREGPQRLILPDEPWLYLMAEYMGGSEPSRHAHRPKVEMQFLCADPVAYGRHRSKSVSGTQRITAGGTYKSFPIITSNPPAGSYWQVTDVGTGRFVRVNASLTGGQTVVIDMGMQRCTVNGYDVMPDPGSTFFPLEGTCDLLVSGGSAVIEWDERWI